VVLDIDKDNRRLSLGHKQLEENPWDVFETIFTPDSIHEGTVVDLNDKGAIIALPYGVEGFSSLKHLVKEDGAMVKIDEKLPFKVIEFSKSANKIILSHTRVYENIRKAGPDAERKRTPSAAGKVHKKVKQGIEKTTFGDITELAALKTKMEKNENKKKKEEKNADNNEKSK